MAATKKAARELTVLKRAVCKKASTSYAVAKGDLICLVKNDKEDVYTVTLRNTGKHTCTCAGNASFGRKCYHIKHVECQENIRRESAALAPKFAAKAVPVWTMWLLEAGVLAVPSKQVAEALVAPVKVKTVALAVVSPKVEEQDESWAELIELEDKMSIVSKRDTSVLNGAQQSAGVLMALPSRKAFVSRLQEKQEHKSNLLAEAREIRERRAI